MKSLLSQKSSMVMLILLLFIFARANFFSAFAEQEEKNKEFTVIAGLTEAQANDFTNRLQKAQKDFAPIAEHLSKGKDFLQKKEFKQAENEYKSALDSSKGSVDKGLARYGLADVYEKKGDYKKAIQTLQILRDENTADFAKPELDARISLLKTKLIAR